MFLKNQRTKVLFDTGASDNAFSEKNYGELKLPCGRNAPLLPLSEMSKRSSVRTLYTSRWPVPLWNLNSKSHFHGRFSGTSRLSNTGYIKFGRKSFFSEKTAWPITERQPIETTILDPPINWNRHETSRNGRKTLLLRQNNRKSYQCLEKADEIEMLPALLKKIFTKVCGNVASKLSFEEKTGLCFTSSLCRIDSEGNIFVYTRPVSILKSIDWREYVLTHNEKNQREDLQIEFSATYAKLRFDVGLMSEIT